MAAIGTGLLCGGLECLRRLWLSIRGLDPLQLGNTSWRDWEDHITDWSAGCRSLYGFDAHEAEGRVAHELLHTRFPQPLEQIQSALLTGGRWEGELTHHAKDDREVIVRSVWVLHRARFGRSTRVLVLDTDITEHQRTAERLIACDERYRIMSQAMLQGFMQQSPDGRILAVNPAGEQMLGRTAADLIGRVPMDQDWNMVREDRTPLHRHDFPATVAARTGRRVDSTVVGVWNPRAQAYRWLSMTAIPLLGPGPGRLAEIHTLLADVTETQRNDAAIQRAAQCHQKALEAAIMGTWDYHPASGSMFWDQRCRSIFGVGFGDRIDYHTIMALVHEEDRPRVETEFKRALDTASSGAYESEYRVVWPDGSVHWVNAIGQAYFKGAGAQRQALRFIGTTLDITERKRLEEERDALLASERAARTEAERANRLKDEFVATLSHELRNPLNVILGWVQILERSKRTPTDVDEAVQVIHGSGRILAELISELLDMSRITSGKLLLDMQTIDPAAVIAAALETARPAIDAKGIRLETSLAQAVGRSQGDPSRLKQVVWNLLSNAVKFTGRGGLIRVDTVRLDSRLEISVSDTGQGIDPEFLPHIFERFRQEDASAARKHGGLGLGLSIARSLVEMHGGSIRVSSPGRGRGASFTLTLPMLASTEDARPLVDGPSDAAALSAGVADSALEGVKVLVVDDDRGSLEIVKRVLEERRAMVFIAASARQGLELLQRVHPDVLISDIGMPEEDGYRFLRRVRALEPERGGATPALALTAFASPEDRRRAMLSGYQAHLTKPIETGRLIATIASLARHTGESAAQHRAG